MNACLNIILSLMFLPLSGLSAQVAGNLAEGLMKQKQLRIFACLALAFSLGAGCADANFAFFCGQALAAAPVDLKTEALANPLLLDSAHPRFSWRLETERAGAKQAAWQVQVASAPDRFDAPDLWDSGWVESDDNAWNAYAGQPLEPFQDFFWRVRLREDHGHETAWSQPARAELGPLFETDWRAAAWLKAPDYAPDTSVASTLFVRHVVAGGDIEPARKVFAEKTRPLPLLRREFELPFEPTRARAYLAAVGFADLRVNGQAASDRLFDPAHTHYTNRRLFSAIDLTGLLQKGRNAVGISLGNGWSEAFYKFQPDRLHVIHYGRPEVRLLVLAEGSDGERVWLTTDGSWKVMDGPVRRAHLYVGEHFDARRMPEGWDQPDFDDSEWQPATSGAAFAGEFEPMLSPPERVMKTLRPVSVIEPSPGVFIFELPETTTGWPRLRVRGGEAGQTVILRVSQAAWGPDWGLANPNRDLLHYDGEVRRRADGLAFLDNYIPFESKAGKSSLAATYAYTCRGEAEEIWTPRFNYMPGRYIEVLNYPGTPTIEDISFEVIHADLPRIGESDPGHPVMRELQQKFLNTFIYCSHDTLQDNPNHERGGWTMDAYQAYAMFAHYHECGLFIDKFMADVRANFQHGLAPTVCPSIARGDGRNAMDWSASTSLVAWENYLRTGNLRALEAHFPAMKETLGTIEKMTEGKIENLRGLGDWLDAAPGGAQPRPKSPFADYGYGANMPLHTHPVFGVGTFVMGAADATARTARLLGEDPARWEQMAASLRAQLRERFFKDGGFGSQTANASALSFGLVTEPDEIASVAAEFDRIVREEWNGHPNAGYHAVREVAQMLGTHGYPETANNMFLVEGYPSWRDATKGKRTTIGPGWGPSIARQVQQTHGSGGRWFMSGLAGINLSEQGPGYRHVLLAPQFPQGHPSASAEIMTPQGKLASAWQRDGDAIRWKVTIPWNTTATVSLHGHGGITVNGKPQEKSEFDLPAGKWEIVSSTRQKN